MIESDDLHPIMMVPAVVLAAAALAALVWLGAHAVRYVVADKPVRPVLRTAWRIKYTWRQTARRVGLVQVERRRPPIWSSTPHTAVITRELVPTVKVTAERWGVRIDASTIGRLGVKEFTDAAGHLADVWRVPLVRVEQTRPGRVRLRALLSDPLTEPSAWTGASGDPAVWMAGIDADGQPVTIRSSGVSGVVVAGLAGYGKTSFLNARFCQLAPSSAVQFVLIDGKGGPDYDDLFTRAWLSAKDDPQLVRDHLVRIRDLLVARQRSIRAVLGVKNMWHVGPSVTWPLVVVVIDEAHTFLNETKGTDADSKRLDALARETARLTEELIRKGRNVGIQVILATQKATGDAIPTRIRDNCQVAVSFAQRTSEAATAALGSDISGFPNEHPRRLQDPAYVGVASMVAEGRPGFTLVRTPYVPDAVADRIAEQTADLVRDPIDLLTVCEVRADA
ncbi:MAG: segregation ATPase FtsK/SpoIIIE, family [Actinoplanes sp.]|jgi:S-DNA-T family DNA segregation ATPase FtsK/SpoIIIE|nr:segregation ATPase FtsK/SpoIIIE, family [Actinoplanes sp.]